MLLELHIRDFAIIDDVTLTLAGGFNVLSGETGAGKSIVVGALGLLLGERASADQVRSGAERALIEGTFDLSSQPPLLAMLDEEGLPVDDGLATLRREIHATGRGRAWINGSSTSVAALARVGRRLASIHGQHEAQALLDVHSQCVMLDAYAGATALAGRVRQLQARRRDLDDRRAALEATRRETVKRSDYLNRVVAEIEAARLSPGEEEEIDEAARRLEHAEELVSLAAAANELLAGDDSGALAVLARVRKLIDSLVRIDPPAARYGEVLASGMVNLSELARDITDYAARIELDPERLRQVSERRELIFRLGRKYGGSIDEILRNLAGAREELAVLESAEDSKAALGRALSETDAALLSAAAELTARRRDAAAALSEKASSLLPSLGLPGGRFHVVVKPRDQVRDSGAEDIEFLIELNAGHEPRPLAKVASGGELSRIMLALKSILADVDDVRTLVFDEVDAGIGGQIALRVGDALRALARNHQVLVITHLPQIASRAHNHLVVRKSVREGLTTADIDQIQGNDRVAEIARMLSGDSASAIGRKHASELLRAGREI